MRCDDHIVIGHGELGIHTIKLHVDGLLVFSLVRSIVINGVRSGCYVRLADAGIGDALKLILYAVNGDDHVAADLITIDRVSA